ncbi:glycoside hydrolase family 16 protein, partial [Pseudocercospora fijiensis CIRAD86]
SYGFVHYVDRATAESLAMVNSTGNLVRFGAESTQVLDPFANLGRKSIRLTSKQTWTRGLFILDLAHMPSSTCGIWPAFWMLGNGPLLWPVYGELDVIEFTNDATSNLIALHTAPNCTIAGSGQTGTLLTNDCGEDEGYKGCNISPTQPNSVGTGFNSNGGGVYAVEWTSVAIRVWFFPRNNIPASVTAINPDTSTWGLPAANYEGSCNIDSYFTNASLVFNIDFCGTWAGPTFNTNTGCPVLNATNQWSSCNAFVATSPQAFIDAYWEVNYLKVFQA